MNLDIVIGFPQTIDKSEEKSNGIKQLHACVCTYLEMVS